MPSFQCCRPAPPPAGGDCPPGVLSALERGCSQPSATPDWVATQDLGLRYQGDCESGRTQSWGPLESRSAEAPRGGSRVGERAHRHGCLLHKCPFASPWPERDPAAAAARVIPRDAPPARAIVRLWGCLGCSGASEEWGCHTSYWRRGPDGGEWPEAGEGLRAGGGPDAGLGSHAAGGSDAGGA